MARKAAAPPLPVLGEKQEELYCDQTARMLGYEVIRFSQPRRTMQTRGVSDRLYVHPVYRVAVWAELKSEKGRLSAHQEWFLTLMSTVQRTTTVHGTANTVGQFLVDILQSKPRPSGAPRQGNNSLQQRTER